MSGESCSPNQLSICYNTVALDSAANITQRTDMDSFDTYASPLSWRYASPEMRALWGETNKLKTWRRLWVALAQAQHELGAVTSEQLEDLKQHVNQIDLERTRVLEAETRHDLVSEIKCYSEQAPLGGAVLHLGATSTDIKDNAEVLIIRQSLDLLLSRIEFLLSTFAEKITDWADLPVMAFTHLQPAEPTTLGYRFSFYAQDLWEDYRALRGLRAGLRGKGFKGAVGTSASFVDLFGVEKTRQMERRLSELLAIPFYEISTQVYPRKQDYSLLCALASLGATLYKFAFDLRILQSPAIFELSEPFGKDQVGSSAMPFKKNPINAEKIDSLARLLSALPQTAWANAAHSLFERTMDDSANQRMIIPEAFLLCDEILLTSIQITTGLQVHTQQINQNFEKFALFASTERILLEAVKKGLDRQQVHARLRDLTLQAWQAIQTSQPNPLPQLLSNEPLLTGVLSGDEILSHLDVRNHLGLAPQKARAFAQNLTRTLTEIRGI